MSRRVGSGSNRRWPFGLLIALVWLPLQARELTVLGVFADRALVELDGRRRVLRLGEEADSGMRLLSTDTRSGLIWLEIHGERRQAGVVRRSDASFRSGNTHSVKIFPDASGNLVAAGGINGQAVSFAVEPRVGFIVMSAAEARRLGIDYARGELDQVPTASGSSFGYRVVLDRVRVGRIEQRNVDALVLQVDMPRFVQLGMSFLDRVEMRHEGSVLVLEPKR